MDDYVYLEETGRKVGDWGKEIVRGGYMAGNNNMGNTRGRGDVRGRGRGMRGRDRGGAGASGPGKTKRDILKMQLEVRDIEMDLLPVGMERRKVNQSTWDFKNQTALLTIEFKFYKPKDPLAPSSQPREPPYMLLTHRNDTRTSLLSLIRSHVHHRGNSKKETAHPEWVKRLLYPDPDDPESFSNPQCQREFADKKGALLLRPAQPLAALLRHTQFVEIPTIEIWDEFTGYGSDEDEEEPEPENVLAALGNYAGSDEDEDSGPPTREGGSNELDHADLEGLSDDGDDVEVDPAVLLELMRAARGGQPWAIEEDEAVDWGDMDDGELE
ncbi:hypothetical protein BDZ97DRAFT_1751397 [Flammula alnicola]|nr:hypothetical protein BDZ97DRAFT_1751397 [Flammula alnicola]